VNESLKNARLYGAASAALLQRIQAAAPAQIATSTQRFHDEIGGGPRMASILERLSPAELTRALEIQTQYICRLISPELTAAQHQDAARRAGRIHSMIGLPFAALIEAYELYLSDLTVLIGGTIPAATTAAGIVSLVNGRIYADIEHQISAARGVNDATAALSAAIDRVLTETTTFADMVNGVLATLGKLPGDVRGMFGRLDAEELFQVEFVIGNVADIIVRSADLSRMRRFAVAAAGPGPSNPARRAWLSGKIERCDSWARDDRMASWRDIGERLRIRSSVAVPVRTLSGRTFAVLTLYSRWPGYFATSQLSSLLHHAQLLLSIGIERVKSYQVVPLGEQRGYRALLAARRVVMHYQPIIDLADGRLVKVEALARLKGADGALVSPARFLPAFGEQELFGLFEQGVQQVCEEARRLDAAGLPLEYSLNFPAESLGDPRYEESILSTLARCSIRPQRMHLELMETPERDGDNTRRLQSIERLRSSGVRIDLDDLGSGHSSLMRMERYPYDEIKIDRAFLLDAIKNPQRALEFILYLSRLAHALGMPVTVEGLESLGMLEAALILGADRGQGFGIGKPMSAEDLQQWAASYRFPVDAQTPRTALGAMAALMSSEVGGAVKGRLPQGLVEPTALLERYLTAHGCTGEDPLAAAVRAAREAHLRSLESYQLHRGQVLELLTECWKREERP
jgi:EAL domain-containing protein (putative c-di-GMP-specific phosphodiesterase class I)